MALSFELTREPTGGRNGIPGELAIWRNGDLAFECRTLELDWNENAKDVSCIPRGEYEVSARRVGDFAARAKRKWDHGFVPWIRGVEGREYILVHWGSLLRATRGCILVGQTAGVSGNENAVWHSQKTYRRLFAEISPFFEAGDGKQRYPFIIRDWMDEDEEGLSGPEADRSNI